MCATCCGRRRRGGPVVGALEVSGQRVVAATTAASAVDHATHARECWATLERQLEPEPGAPGTGPNSAYAPGAPTDGCSGCFSFAEFGSGEGYLAMRIARKFPNATVLALEQSQRAVDAHLANVSDALEPHAEGQQALGNDAVCRTTIDKQLLLNLYESPELLRYALLSRPLTRYIAEKDVSETDWPSFLGAFVSTALTSFVKMPSAAHMSLAMALFFPLGVCAPAADGGGSCSPSAPRLLGPYYVDARHGVSFDALARFARAAHPTPRFSGFERLCSSQRMRRRRRASLAFA